MTPQTKIHRSYTLIEILVVICIIALLVALLLPALGHARRSAQNSQCVGNLRQLAFGMLSYADDYMGRLPPYSSATAKNNHPGLCWPKWVFPYVKSTECMRCPSSLTPPFLPNEQGWQKYDGSYGWNYDGTQGNRGTLASHIRCPSNGYLLMDSGDPCIIYGTNDWDNLMEELDLDWDSGCEGCNRHSGKTNVVFVDAHAESRELDTFISAPCKSHHPPWYIPWENGMLEKYEIPFPDRN